MNDLNKQTSIKTSSHTLKRDSLFNVFLSLFKPSIFINHFSKLKIQNLIDMGVKIFICDLDNTLVPHYNRFPNKDVIEFINKIQDANIKFIIVSNNRKERVVQFCNKLNVDEYYYSAKKPLPKVLNHILEKHNVNNNEVIMMGDLLITDILSSNFAKIQSILVEPLISDTKGFKQMNNFINRFLNKKIEKRNIFSKSEFNSQYNLNVDYEIL